MADKAQAIEKMSFEEALAELERIVAQLEKGNVPLDQSISIYERGDALRTRCDALLKDAEARIEKIVQSGGKATGTTPLDVE